MKKLEFNDDIKKKHLIYCIEKTQVKCSHLSNEDKEKLFIKNPFDKNNALLKGYSKFINLDFQQEYETFRKSYNKIKWCGYKLIDALKINVCPYCGQSYFSTVKYVDEETAEVKIKTEATFDHYYAKAQNQFLALNLYNLIPVCPQCNSTYKNTQKKPIINPFIDNPADLIKFELSNYTIPNFLNKNKELKVQAKNTAPKDKQKITDNHIKNLWLSERYQVFQGIIRSIILKKQAYETTGNDELIKLMKKYGFEVKTQDIEDFVFKQDLLSENEPFFKFKKDIWKQIS